ncbi:glycosyltransferase family 2 protein [Pedobacter mucosus]|uniref:glycosyltransferase family 2 protein n=1 Tax=Pedobacter mucosus TaxID=2895286 RepID=UPI001EE44E79|nr:glycosyltransferase family 2 protein [Pedobacter mucosus]UKT64390.1 glycosyltransferase [Pedobacter mucosus]
MLSPLVSVIIPLYNSAKHIGETLQCIYDQSYKNIEVIIVDDGSKDDSYKIVNSLKNKNTLVLSQPNRGASAARNAGLELASGELVQFIDADDLLSPDKIENQVNAINSDYSKLTVCSTIHFADGTIPSKSQPSAYEETFILDDTDTKHFLINLMGGYQLGGSMIPIHSWLVPKKIIEAIGPWNENLSMDDDGEYFCRAVLNANGIIKTDGFSYYRRQSAANSSLSSQTNLKSYESMLQSYTLRKQHILKKTNSYEAKVAVYKLFMNLAVGSYIHYPNISRLALAEVPNVYVPNYEPSVGGPLSTRLAKLLGWKTIKHLQNYYNKLKFKRQPHA